MRNQYKKGRLVWDQENFVKHAISPAIFLIPNKPLLFILIYHTITCRFIYLFILLFYLMYNCLIFYENFFYLFHFVQLNFPITWSWKNNRIKLFTSLLLYILCNHFILNLTEHPVFYRVTTGCQCHADNCMASCESIQCVRVDIRKLLRIWYSASVSGRSHPDLRSSGWHSIVQHAALQSASSEAHPLFLVGGQWLALESHLSRQSHERRANE